MHWFVAGLSMFAERNAKPQCFECTIDLKLKSNAANDLKRNINALIVGGNDLKLTSNALVDTSNERKQ